jgi:cell division protein FtsB
MALKGRHWVAVWLLAFLAVAWIVIARQTSAIRAARDLAALREEYGNLAGHGADLERRIRAATSRAVLQRRARGRLGLRLPTDTEIILLPVPSGEQR